MGRNHGFNANDDEDRIIRLILYGLCLIALISTTKNIVSKIKSDKKTREKSSNTDDYAAMICSNGHIINVSNLTDYDEFEGLYYVLRLNDQNMIIYVHDENPDLLLDYIKENISFDKENNVIIDVDDISYSSYEEYKKEQTKVNTRSRNTIFIEGVK